MQRDMFWSTLAIINNKWTLTQPLIQRKSRVGMHVLFGSYPELLL
jgi:hypothetical protein